MHWLAAWARRLEPQKFAGVHGDIEVSHKPWGPALILAPWNVPGGSVVSKIAAALAAGASCGKHLQLPSRHTRVTQHRATCPDPYHVLLAWCHGGAGCPVILKPSEWAPTALDLIGRAIVDAGLPRGVFQLLHGAGVVGEMLVRDPRVRCVNFTGSAGVGALSLRAVPVPSGGSIALAPTRRVVACSLFTGITARVHGGSVATSCRRARFRCLCRTVQARHAGARR